MRNISESRSRRGGDGGDHTCPTRRGAEQGFDFGSVALPAHLKLSGPPADARFTREAAISYALAFNPGFQASRAASTAVAAPRPQLGVGAVLAPHPGGTTTRSTFAGTDNTYRCYPFPTSGRRRASAYVDVQIAQAALRVNEDAYRIAVSSAHEHQQPVGPCHARAAAPRPRRRERRGDARIACTARA